jgi:hypothetical protein
LRRISRVTFSKDPGMRTAARWADVLQSCAILTPGGPASKSSKS